MQMPIRPRRPFIALFAALLLTQAHAQTMPGDSDGDGLLSPAEFAALSGGRVPFERLDTNDDGFIDRDERKAFRRAAKAKRSDRFAAADSDGDGVLSREEFDAVAPAELNFDELDTNADGVIDVDERNALRRQARERLRNRQESSL
ncbi:MAG: EF-hand domain-containing protein [Pseudomonadota bacterium]